MRRVAGALLRDWGGGAGMFRGADGSGASNAHHAGWSSGG